MTTTTKSESLMDALLGEIQRVTVIREHYLLIPMGFIAAAMMADSLKRATEAISNNDVVAMVAAHIDLREYEE